MNDIDRLTYIAWEMFYDCLEKLLDRSSHQRKNGPFGHRFYSAFVRMAQICMENQWDVREYVSRMFDHVYQGKNFVAPSDLIKQECVAVYLKLCDIGAGGEHTQQWAQMVLSLTIMRETAQDMYPTDVWALQCVHSSFPAWFRVLYLQPFNEQLYAIYGQAAWNDLREDQLLRRFIRKVRPMEVAELENRIGKFADSV